MEEQQRQMAMQQQQEEEEEEPGQMDIEPSGYEHGEPGGALVQEARKLMQQDEEDAAPEEVNNAGPKIKMNRIGRKSKKTDDKAGSNPGQSGAKEAKELWKAVGDKSVSGGFSE